MSSQYPISLPFSPQSKKADKLRTHKGKAKAATHGVDTYDEAAEHDNWQWTILTEPSSSKQAPILSKDGRFMFTPQAISVKVSSTETGRIVSQFPRTSPSSPDHVGHTNDISALLVNPGNQFQLFSASLDGSIKTWDLTNGRLIKSFDVGHPITHMCAHTKRPGILYLAAEWKRKRSSKANRTYHRILVVDIVSTSSSSPRRIERLSSCKGLGVSASGNWLVAIGKSKVVVTDLRQPSKDPVKLASKDELTCLALHPRDELFATGDASGQIRLWYSLGALDSEAQAQSSHSLPQQTTTLHWHAHAIACLTFTSNGAYLLSGGEEAVLVIWQLHSGQKEFIPRLGSPISSVTLLNRSSRPDDYLLRLEDGTMMVVASDSLKVTGSFAELKSGLSKLILDIRSLICLPDGLSFVKEGSRVPFSIHQRSSSLILPSSHLSSLQLFSLSTFSVTGELEVVPSNRISRRDEKPLSQATIEHVVVSLTGDWMCTIDARENGIDFESELSLKFWRWSSEYNKWEVNTRVDRPHGKHAVCSVSFAPRRSPRFGELAVTTGGDGQIKIWHVDSLSDTASWFNMSTVRYRAEIPCACAWAQDASLVVIVYKSTVVILDPARSTIEGVIASPTMDDLVAAHFVGRSSRYMVAQSPSKIFVWDLILGSISYTFEKSPAPCDLLVHPEEDKFLVLNYQSTDHTKAMVFSLRFSEPVVHTIPTHFCAVGCYPSSGRDAGFRIVGLTRKGQIVVAGDEVVTESSTGAVGHTLPSLPAEPSGSQLHDIFGFGALVDARDTLTESSNANASRTKVPTFGLPDTPGYILPSLDSMFDQVLHGLTTVQDEEAPREEDTPERSTQDNVDMDVEEDARGLESRPLHWGAPSEGVTEVADLFKGIFKHGAFSQKSNGVHHNGQHTALNPSAPLATPVTVKQNGALHSNGVVVGSATRPADQRPTNNQKRKSRAP